MQTDPISAIRTSLLDVIYRAMHEAQTEQHSIIERDDINTATKLAIIQELEALSKMLNNKANSVMLRCRQAES